VTFRSCVTGYVPLTAIHYLYLLPLDAIPSRDRQKDGRTDGHPGYYSATHIAYVVYATLMPCKNRVPRRPTSLHCCAVRRLCSVCYSNAAVLNHCVFNNAPFSTVHARSHYHTKQNIVRFYLSNAMHRSIEHNIKYVNHLACPVSGVRRL